MTQQRSSGGLFTIESNRGFERVSIPTTKELEEVVFSFGITSIDSLSVVQKPGTFSRIYCFSSKSQSWILRRINAVQAQTTEHQCRIARYLDDQNFIRPILSQSKTFLVAKGDFAWMVYPEVLGEEFNGFNCDVLTVIERAIQLERSLEKIELQLTDFERDRLVRVHHQPEKWIRYFEILIDPRKYPDNIRKKIGKFAGDLILRNKNFVMNRVGQVMNMQVQRNIKLTHNDLQHANVVIRRGNPVFLDLEDISFENQAISISHAVFKLLRHTILMKASTAEWVRDEALPQVLNLLTGDEFGLQRLEDFVNYGLFRIISDISTILEYVIEQSNDMYLYDLEKKIHNFFEIHYFDRGQPWNFS